MSRPKAVGSSKRRFDANMASPEKSSDSFENGFMEIEAGALTQRIPVWIVHFLLSVRNELRKHTRVYHEFIELMLEVGRQSTNVGNGGGSFSMESCRKRVRMLFDGRAHLIRGFEDLSEGKPFRDKSQSISDSISFVQKMKSCTKISKKDYDRFLEILLFYDKGTMTVDDVLQQVLPLMGDSPELLEEFRNFLPPRLAQAPLRHEHIECSTSKEVKKADDLKYAIEDTKDAYDDGDEDFLHASTLTDDMLPPKVDHSNCPRPTPSYCQLPQNHAALQSSSQTEIEKSILNDALVSVTSGSEDCFKFRIKSRYEENILRCEDDMFERDILLERLIALAKHIKKLTKKLRGDLIDAKLKFDLEKDLTSVDRRCIEQLYEDQGLEMLAALSEDPHAVLPVILVRVNKKAEELKEEKLSLDKASADTIANNYYRSLDHRSSSFKQLDINRMSTKALLAEARETRKMKTKAGNKSPSAVPNQQRSVPDIEFDCIDLGIYEDIYNIISYASSRTCTSDVMTIWRKLIEPLLRVERELSSPSGKASGEEASASEHKDSNKGFCSASDDAIEVDGIFSVTKGNMKTPKSGTDKLNLHDEFLLSSKRDEVRRTDFSVSCVYRTENSPKRLKCNEGYSSQHCFEQEMEEGEFIPHVGNAQPNSLISSERGSYAADSEFEEDNRINDGFQSEVEKDKSIVSGSGFSSEIVSDPAQSRSTQARPEEGGVSFRSLGSLMMPRASVLPKMFYGSNSYVLLRLHQVLYKRLLFTKNKLIQPRPEVEMIPNNESTLYTKFKEKLCSLLDGSIDNSAFEDYCLLTIGPESYELFTLDKLISRIIHQLCTIASNDKDNERGSDIPEGRIFRFTCSPAPTRRSIEPLEREQNGAEKSTESTQQVAQNHLQRRKKRKRGNEQVLLQSIMESS